MQDNMDSSQHAVVESTKTAQAISYIEAINAGIDKYHRGHVLSISEKNKIINDIKMLEDLDSKYIRKAVSLRDNLYKAMSSCLNAMLLAKEQTDQPVQLGPSTGGVQKV
jgi:hypothetical protein